MKIIDVRKKKKEFIPGGVIDDSDIPVHERFTEEEDLQELRKKKKKT